MNFSDILNFLYDSSHQPGKELYIMQLISALCGENEPFKTNKWTTRRSESSKFSPVLPSGLTGIDAKYKRKFYEDKALSRPMKNDILEKKNCGTFTKYLEETVLPESFSGLCTMLGVSDSVDRNILFEGIYEQLIKFASSPENYMENTIPNVVENLSANKIKTEEVGNKNSSEPLNETQHEIMFNKFTSLINEYKIAYFMCSELTHSLEVDKFVEDVNSKILAEYVSEQDDDLYKRISLFNKTLIGFNATLDELNPLNARAFHLYISFLRLKAALPQEILDLIAEDKKKFALRWDTPNKSETISIQELDNEIKQLTIIEELLNMYTRIDVLFCEISEPVNLSL